MSSNFFGLDEWVKGTVFRIYGLKYGLNAIRVKCNIG